MEGNFAIEKYHHEIEWDKNYMNITGIKKDNIGVKYFF